MRRACEPTRNRHLALARLGPFFLCDTFGVTDRLGLTNRLSLWLWDLAHHRGWHCHGRMLDDSKPINDVLGIFTPKTHPPRTVHRQWFDEIGRNQHCPCGRGRKFKNCHGSSHWRSVLLSVERGWLG